MSRHRSRRRKKLPTEAVVTTIEKLSHDGRGIAHVDDKITFISGALAGEEISFCYTSIAATHAEGVTVEVLKASPDRVEAGCAHFGICGGCSLQHMSADDQIKLKEDALLEQFKAFGEVTPEEVVSPLRGDIWGYRRKARLGVKFVPKKGGVLVGFREQRSGFLAVLDSCPVLHPAVGERITVLRELFTKLEAKDKIAQIEVAVGGDDQVALVLRNLVTLTSADEALLIEFAKETGIYLYLQPKGLNSITPLYPADLSLTSLHYALPSEGVHFDFAPYDFTQVNSSINEQMVPRALEWLEVNEKDHVLDLFCGLGNFTLPLAKRAATVVGVEGDKTLVDRAEANAQSQGVFNTRYHVANLMETDLLQTWMRSDYSKVLLDPPRSGAAEIIEKLSFDKTERIVYVSCNPATLARDAGILVNKKGFRLVKAGVMDMFPHTGHVESIALFVR